MQCYNCGNEIEDASNCKYCGAATQQMNMGQPQMNMGQPQMNMGQPQMNMGQPQMNMGQPQMNYGQPQMNYGQPQMNYSQPQMNYSQPRVNNYQGKAFDFGAYFKSFDVLKLVGLEGVLLMFLSIFSSWGVMKSDQANIKISLFQYDGAATVIMGVLIILVSILALVVVLLDAMPVIKNLIPAGFSSLVGLVPAALGILFLIITTIVVFIKNKDIGDNIFYGYGKFSFGMGGFVLFLGCAMVAFPAVMKLIKKK